MPLTPDPYHGKYLITGYQENSVLINNSPYQNTLIIGKNTLITDSLPATLEILNENHLTPLLELKSKLILIGTGKTTKPLPPKLITHLHQQGIGVEVMDTIAACRTLTLLLSEDRDAYAMLFFDK